MKKVYYEETYSGVFEVPEEVANGNTDEIGAYLVDNGYTEEVECSGSIIAPLIGNGDPQYQIMGKRVDALDDNEKKFYLWHLLRHYYKRELYADKEKYASDRTTVDQINRLIANVEELDTLLCYDMF